MTAVGAAGSPAGRARTGGRAPSVRPPAQTIGSGAESATRRRDLSKERKLSLLSVELSRERIRERDREIKEFVAIAHARAVRRARRDAQARALRVRRLLTW